MRLALLISSLYGGGAERVMALLADHWVAQGHSVVLVTYERSPHDYPLDPRVERVVLNLSRNSSGLASAVANNWRRLRALRQAVKDANAAVVVSFEERMNAAALVATAGLGVRRIVCERTDPRRHRIERSWALLRRISYPFADALVVQTEALRTWAARATLAPGRVHVIANPVRCMNTFAPGSDARSSNREIVAVGRLTQAKAFDVLLRAFAEVAAGRAEWRLTIVGEGPERQALSDLAASLGIGDQVNLTGWLREPGVALARATMYVLPSRYEGFPNALLEAMACGLPVIATRCAGASEIVEHEVNGLLVAVDAPRELARAIARLMCDDSLRAALAQNALAVCDRFSAARIGEAWDRVVDAVPPRQRTKLLESQGD